MRIFDKGWQVVGLVGHIVLNILLAAMPIVFLSMGVYLMLRVMGEFDLSVDGLYTTGAAVFGLTVLNGGSPWLGMLLALLAGIIFAFVNIQLHLRLGIPVLLGSLIVFTGLYSINLRILGGSTINLIQSPTIFEVFGEGNMAAVTMLSLLVIAVSLGLYLFLNTRYGLGLRAGGMNGKMARSFGVNTRKTLLTGAMISEALVCVGGALQAQVQGYADVNMGVGSIIIGASAILLGEMIVRQTRKVPFAIVGIVAGAILYETVLVLALRSGLPPQDLRLVTALILIIAIVLTSGTERVGKMLKNAREKMAISIHPRQNQPPA